MFNLQKYSYYFILTCTILCTSCSGSDVYRGKWKATDVYGNNLEIEFDAKEFCITDELGKIKSFGYTQNSIRVEDGVKTYGIRLSDGRNYFILFPLVHDHSKAVIRLRNHQPVYTISRSSYIRYTDLYKLDN